MGIEQGIARHNQSHGSKAPDNRIFNVGYRTRPPQLPIVCQNHFDPILHAEPTLIA